MSRCDCQWGSRARARRSGLLWQPAACGPWSGPAIVWGMIASPNGRVRFHPMEVSTARAACHPAPGSPPPSELEARRGRLSRGLRYASGMSWLGAGACVSDGVLIAVITRGRHNIQAKRSGAAGRSNAHNALGSTRSRILLASASGADSPDARGAEPATARVKFARSAASASPSSRRARPPTGGLYAGNASRGRPPLSGVRHFSANGYRKRGLKTPEQ